MYVTVNSNNHKKRADATKADAPSAKAEAPELEYFNSITFDQPCPASMKNPHMNFLLSSFQVEGTRVAAGMSGSLAGWISRRLPDNITLVSVDSGTPSNFFQALPEAAMFPMRDYY